MKSSHAPVLVADEDFESFPHETFRKMRPLTPVIEVPKPAGSIYVALRAADLERLAMDVRTRQPETEVALARGVVDGALFDFFRNTMLFTNGADHRRRRAPLSRAFAYKLITAMRPRIRAIAHRLIDGFSRQGEVDFVEHFASLLPAYVIGEILGIAEADIPAFTRCTRAMARALGTGFSRTDVPALQAAAAELASFAKKILEERRGDPREDFFTAYIRAIDETQQLSAVEATIQIVTVILAGSDTTRGSMAIQTGLLLQHPEQWSAVCLYPALIPGAVAECLRYEPSVGSFPRLTLEDIEIGECIVPRNRVLSLSTLSAMRDPELYADADSFDIRRIDHPRKHPAFGFGVHRCLGEVLATAELEEGLAALAARLPDLELVDGPPAVRGAGGIRAVGEMRVRWSRRH
jgi:cytochrome P450 family 103